MMGAWTIAATGCGGEDQAGAGDPVDVAEPLSYASADEWPTVSAQCHWTPSTDPAEHMVGHTHLDMTAPMYADVDGPVTVDFAVKLFHVAGIVVVPPDYQLSIRDIVWDETGTTTAPIMRGDPDGLKVWTGHMTIDPEMYAGAYQPPAHGWFAPTFNAYTFFDNGDSNQLILLVPLYSVLDPDAPLPVPNFPLVASHCSPHSSRSGVAWGVNFVDIGGALLPVAPTQTEWPLVVGTAGYGARDLSAATFEQRADLDLHHANSGTLLASETAVGDINASVVIDPSVLGPGSHKMAFMRTQPDGEEAVSTLLVVDVVVGDDVPQDPPDPGDSTDPSHDHH